MFELSSRLIGIYKVANQTRSVAIGKPSMVLALALSNAHLLTPSLAPRASTDNSDLHQIAVTAAA